MAVILDISASNRPFPGSHTLFPPICGQYRGCINKILHLLAFIAFSGVSSSIARILSRRHKTHPLTSGFVNCITLCPVSNEVV